ncbi:uncharacterized protein TRIVIDRAFT_221632 [Trichoderma virens Gv29-8]|uniref:Zn(2)-C6 fungal-type domain-containing protein n=1 Tax=Hypocrea virens (strain Gv29-8 / FGSC 10586) TaxID=413071 RepID=G9MTJ9_HYPVG|nr:uncharacterized protein TRIVIDRAFT_221632 [Trichoderma virens Gv29-8]EHK22350.1 hypothetical protein TRIVIDRAFT_221632 [Trichoderma virens Gv29-8]UKZ47389.1 hypothetical protein TrVGV298_001607 [Trichoderma virens]
MGDYYRQFLSTMSGADGYLPTSPDEMNQVLGPGIPLPMSTPPMHSPYPSTMGNMGYFAGYPEPTIINAPKASKSRRRSAASQGGNLDQVKHRRTRSGCYTCRSRRVKCDETRPICDRCRKGSRDCIYPEPPGSKGNSGQPTAKSKDGSSAQYISPTSSNEGEEDDTEQETRLGTIPDDDEPDGLPRRESVSAFSQPRRASAASPNMALTSARQTSETPSQDGNKSVSPSTSNVTTGSWTPAGYQGVEAILPASGGLDRLHLPQDFRSYLRYFKENMTNYHYGLAVDEDDFFNSELPSVAIQCEPLLNALVGFAAYHVTLQNSHGQLQDFLQYYNKSVTQLLSLLKRKETHSVHVLLTILQLATIEEYLGDWVNLMGHQKAAFEILTQIYTPETAMQTSIGRMCLSWYARFDNIVALMGRFPTEIPREWFTTMIAYYQTQMASNPTELRWKIEDRSARLRLISYDMSTLYARGSRKQISPTDYSNEHCFLTAQLEEWKGSWDPMLCDQKHLITDFNWQRPLSPDDIVNPYRPGLLYDHPLFNSTVITMEWHSIVIMHKTQSPNISPEQLFSELGGHAFTVCELFECLEYWPDLPSGALIAVQPCLAIAGLFLPHQPSNNMWLRRKFALLEAQGHINPATRREKMAEIFGDPSCARWWLPNDEGFTPILQSVRSFADERNARAVNTQQVNLREVKHLFDKLIL